MSFMINFIRRQFLSSWSNNNSNDTEADSNNNEINNVEEEQEQRRACEWSVDRVLSSGRMLTDNEIYAALKIIKRQFSGIRGLYDPQSMNAKLIRKAKFYVQYPDRFVQILHDGSLHWFTLTNLRSSKAHQIQSYDSLFVESTYVHNKMLQTSLKKLFVPQSEEKNEAELCYLHIECTVESVQKQSDTTMCGLFAIAFALDLCRGEDPASRVYDETRMRSHLCESLKQGYFEPFPSSSASTSTSKKSKTHIIYIDI